MSLAAPAPATSPVTDDTPVIAVVSRKVPVLFGVLTLGLGLAILLSPQSGETTYRLASRDDFFTLPDITVPAQGTAWLMVALMAVCTGESVRRYLARRSTPLWLSCVFAVLAMTGFLTWAAAGGTVPMVGLLGGSLAVAVPLIFGALGGVLGERAGVVNIAIDGQLLAGAFAAALLGSFTGSVWGGLLGAMAAGAAGGRVARVVRHQLLRRPGDRRRRAERPGHRPHQLHVPAGARAQRRRAQRTPAPECGRDPVAERDPAARPRVLPAVPRSSTGSTSRWRS